MEFNFIRFFLDPAIESKGGFTPEEKAELQKGLKDVQDAIETKVRANVEEALKKHAEPINDAIKKFSDWKTEKDETDKKNQQALDKVLTEIKELQKSSTEKVAAKSIHQAIFEALSDPDNLKELDAVGRGRRAKIMLKGPSFNRTKWN